MDDTNTIPASEAIRALAKKNGGTVTPELVFNAAKPDASPLHDYFYWDHDDAWNRYNLQIASRLIASIKVTVETALGSVKASVFKRAKPIEGETGDPIYSALPDDRVHSVSTPFAVMVKDIEAGEKYLRKAAEAAETAGLSYGDEILKLADACEEFRMHVAHDMLKQAKQQKQAA